FCVDEHGLKLEGVDRIRGGFALDDDGDLNGDLLAALDAEQVDVLDLAANRVHLDVAGEGEVFAAVVLQGDAGAGVAAQREPGRVAGQAQVHGVAAVTVEHSGDLAVAARAAGRALAEFGTHRGVEVNHVVRHGVLLVLL